MSIFSDDVTIQAISGPHPPAPSPFLGEEELNPFKVPLPSGERDLG